jgi:hypothetical protein
VSAKLDEMWAALEAHKPKRSYAKAWRVMLKERTAKAADAACDAAPAGSVAHAAWYAYSALFVAGHRSTDYHAQRAIEAIKEVKP